MNESIVELGERFGLRGETLELLCECQSPHCSERVVIPLEEYERLHEAGRHVVALGHEPGGGAGSGEGYAVVSD